MQHSHIAQKIIKLKDEDLAFRDNLIQNEQLGDGYHPEMEAIHIRNAEELNTIIDSIGYPTISKVGEKGSQAAWLIIQHAISLPSFMKRCAQYLEVAVIEGQANPKQLAYLNDRIAVFEGRLQLFGTSFDWDANGELSPQPYDKIELVDKRRKGLGMNTLTEQIKLMRDQAKKEGQSAPQNLEERKKQYDLWRSRVGWLTI